MTFIRFIEDELFDSQKIKNLSDYFETHKVFFDLNLQKVIKT